jgi:hypothetical protein
VEEGGVDETRVEPMTRVAADHEPLDVYIGRGRGPVGYFGNPCVVGRACSRCERFHASAADAVEGFRAYFMERVEGDHEFAARVLALRGRALWCPGRCKSRGGPCHGDVIVEWIEANA